MPDHTGLPQDHAKSSPQERWAMGDPLKGDKGTVLIASTRRGKKPPGFSVAAMWYNEAEDWLKDGSDGSLESDAVKVPGTFK